MIYGHNPISVIWVAGSYCRSYKNKVFEFHNSSIQMFHNGTPEENDDD